MTILIEKVEAPMAIKRTYSELGDAAAAALVAGMAQREESPSHQARFLKPRQTSPRHQAGPQTTRL
jgi:hypothetical protein